jgi:hypothetical protein
MIRRRHLSPISAFHEGNTLMSGMRGSVFTDGFGAKQEVLAFRESAVGQTRADFCD